MKKGVDTWRSRFVTVLLTVMGIIVLAYPVVASQWNNARQQAVARQYAVSERQVPPQLLERSLARAEQYIVRSRELPFWIRGLREFLKLIIRIRNICTS